jgi:hypothetical protein
MTCKSFSYMNILTYDNSINNLCFTSCGDDGAKYKKKGSSGVSTFFPVQLIPDNTTQDVSNTLKVKCLHIRICLII